MKQYFDFTVTGKRLLPIWLIMFVLIVIPYSINTYYSTTFIGEVAQSAKMQSLAIQLLLMLVGYLLVFFFIKITMEGVRYKEKNVEVHVDFSTYLLTLLLGILLSIITLFIYTPWFVRKLTKLFCDNSSLDSEEFEFKGSGGRLFVIVLLTIILPMVVIGVLTGLLIASNPKDITTSLLFNFVILFVMLPYMYFTYKWFVDVDYKKYHIAWDTNFWESILKLFVEILVSTVTFGIYLPMAYLRLYGYFAQRTIATSEDSTLKFGFEYNAKKDFLYIWGQILLTIVTLGIYYPWAYANIGKRFLSQTYLENVDAE
jgi:uncharacterized membrane protein YjgN (DUF898 family)